MTDTQPDPQPDDEDKVVLEDLDVDDDADDIAGGARMNPARQNPLRP